MISHRVTRFQVIDDIFASDNYKPKVNNVNEGAEIIHKEEDLDAIMNKFEHILLKENRIWWEVVSLEKYLADNIIPRGLKISNISTFESNNSNFKIEWQQILNNCSFSLINLILKERRDTLRQLEEEIIRFEALTEPFLNLAEYKELEKAIEKKIRKNEKEIVARKQKKFYRDRTERDHNIIVIDKDTLSKKQENKKPKISGQEIEKDEESKRNQPIQSKGVNNKQQK